MPAKMKEKITFLNGEITGLKSRMANQDNAVQAAKLALLEDIRSDYQKSIDRVSRQEGGE